jgi:hypothetical protein
MAISVGKLAPSAIVLAFVGYCVWPSLSDLTSTPLPPKAPAKIREVPVALFSPTMPPVPTRNPWGGLDAAALAAVKESTKPVDTQSESVVDAAMAEATAGPTDSLAGLQLSATSILGDQRVAIINGQICAAHETLNAENAAYRVVRVLPYKVVLEHDGKIVELTYSNVTSRADTSAEGGVQAKPASAKASVLKKRSADPEEFLKQQPAALDALLKKSGALGLLLKKQQAAMPSEVSDAINPSNKAGN